MMHIRYFIATLALLLLSANLSSAQIPGELSYQGYLEDAGTPVTGTLTLTFRLFEAPTGGSAIWTEVQTGIGVDKGVFSTLLGQVLPLTALTFDQPLWLSIAIGGTSEPQLSPRTLLAPAPYARFAEVARVAEPAGPAQGDLSGEYPNPTVSRLQGRTVSTNAPSTGYALKWNGAAWAPSPDLVGPGAIWVENAGAIHYTAGHVGVGTTTPASPFNVGEGKTVLFGADTLGKTNYYPDPKLMFFPAKAGAFRVGQLNADGSLPQGTGYDYWDPSQVGWGSVAIGNNTKATGAGSVAIGIRGYAGNFGSVAIGHLARAYGNSAVSAGYYTRADAFVSTAVGSANVGGGNKNSWVNTDPIFEVGNSIDTTYRSNAFTVLKNGRVGINHASPQSMLDIEQPNSGPGNGVLLNLASIGHWETGVDNSADYNFYFNNSLKGYILDSDGTYIKTSDRRLKTSIRVMQPVLDSVVRLKPSRYRMLDGPSNAPLSYGFVAQEVEEVFPELVHEKDGVMMLDYSGFGILAIKAIQELQALVEAQRDQIAILEQRVSSLEQR